MGSVGAGSGSLGMPKKSAMRRSDRKPERMHSCGSGWCGVSTVDRSSAAESSSAPAAVIQDRPGSGERKNASAGWEVWVSSMSANQRSQSANSSFVWSIRPIVWWRMMSRTAEGGSPARTSSSATSSSRRSNEA